MLSKYCEEHKAKIVEGIAQYNAALTKGDFNAMAAAETVIKEAEGEYAKQAQLDLFSAHKDDENPVREILKEGFYGIYRHKPIRENGQLLGWELTDGEKQVDIKTMFSYLQITGAVWAIRIERLTEVLCEWVCEEIGRKTGDVLKTFKMSAKARELDVGPKPTSNTSMLKLLQSCIDEIVNIPGEDGKNTVKANNRDLKFLQHCFDGEGSGRNNLKTMKSTGVTRVIGKVLYRIINDYAYDADFKKIVEKNDGLEAQRAANRKAKEAKVEVPVTEEVETMVVEHEEKVA